MLIPRLMLVWGGNLLALRIDWCTEIELHLERRLYGCKALVKYLLGR